MKYKAPKTEPHPEKIIEIPIWFYQFYHTKDLWSIDITLDRNILILDINIITKMRLNIHTNDLLCFNLDLLWDDGFWGLHPLYYPCRIAGPEMTRLAAMKTYMICLGISVHIPSFSMLETPELVISKPVSSPTLATYLIVLLISSTLVSCIEPSAFLQLF